MALPEFSTLWPQALDQLYQVFGFDAVISRGTMSAPVRVRGTLAQGAEDAGFGSGAMVRGQIKLRVRVASMAATQLGYLTAGDDVRLVHMSQDYRVHGAPLKLPPRALEWEFDAAPVGVKPSGGV